MAEAKPGTGHMCIKSFLDLKLIKYVVSQNCDGLHFRSGISRQHLSEVHGNCFIEVSYKVN
eukprot:Pgem_evm1s17640